MSAKVKLGNDVIEGVETVQIENADTPGEYVAFTLGSEKPEQTKTTALNMASGDQTITPDSGKALTQVTITKPDTLIAGNIKKDVNIGGVVGSLETGSTIPGGKTLTFYDDDDSMYAIHQVKSGERVVAPDSPTKQDYHFVGWDTTKGDASTRLVFPFTPSTDLSAWAAYVDFVDLETASWNVVRAASDAGTASSLWSVGDVKSIIIPSGTKIGDGLTFSSDTTLYTFIMGFDHNIAVEASGYSHSITFGTFKTANPGSIDITLYDSKGGSSVSADTYFSMNNTNSNAGGWKDSRMRYNLLGSTDTAQSDASSTTATSPAANTFMAALPAALRAVMKPVIKWTDNVGGSSSIAGNVSALVDYLPLLAEQEVFGTRTYANAEEQNHQAQYQYYINGGSTKKYNVSSPNSAVTWWLRSPSASTATSFCYVNSSGNAAGSSAGYSYGCSPLFVV